MLKKLKKLNLNLGKKDRAPSQNAPIEMDDTIEDQETAFVHKGQKSGDVSRFMIFLRVLSILNMMFGAYCWLFILGALDIDPGYFDSELLFQIIVLFAATTSLVASLGLWFLAQWGITIWILIALILITYSSLQNNVLFSLQYIIMSQSVLLVLYIWLKRKYEYFILEFGYQHM